RRHGGQAHRAGGHRRTAGGRPLRPTLQPSQADSLSHLGAARTAARRSSSGASLSALCTIGGREPPRRHVMRRIVVTLTLALTLGGSGCCLHPCRRPACPPSVP